MKLTLPSFEQIEQRVLTRWGGTPLASAGPTSLVRLLLRSLLAELTQPDGIWPSLDQISQAAHPGTAQGEDLDGTATFFGELGKRRTAEADAQYRQRLTRIVPSQEPGSLESLQASAQALTGVAEVAVRPYAFGPGSFALAFVGPADAINVAKAIQKWVAPGSYYRVYPARTVRVRLSISIRLAAKTAPADRLTAMTTVDQAVRRQIQRLGLGATLALDSVRRAAIESHPTVVACIIRSVEADDTVTPIEDVLVPWDSVAALADGKALEVLDNA